MGWAWDWAWETAPEKASGSAGEKEQVPHTPQPEGLPPERRSGPAQSGGNEG